MELDHLFVRATLGAPEAALLRAFGLSEGSPNTHPGQGTANRRFFFHNAFIELLWIADESEASSEPTRRTQLHTRLGAVDGVSPFGVCFRPSRAGEAVAFDSWAYTPGYLPPGMQVDIAARSPLAEPMWFFLEGASAPDAAPAARRQPLGHAAAVRDISALTITVPGRQAWSPAALAAIATGKIRLAEGAGHLLEIVFDQGASGRVHDFRPALPLVFRY